jgi:hypothetical protein
MQTMILWQTIFQWIFLQEIPRPFLRIKPRFISWKINTELIFRPPQNCLWQNMSLYCQKTRQDSRRFCTRNGWSTGKSRSFDAQTISRAPSSVKETTAAYCTSLCRAGTYSPLPGCSHGRLLPALSWAGTRAGATYCTALSQAAGLAVPRTALSRAASTAAYCTALCRSVTHGPFPGCRHGRLLYCLGTAALYPAATGSPLSLPSCCPPCSHLQSCTAALTATYCTALWRPQLCSVESQPCRSKFRSVPILLCLK